MPRFAQGDAFHQRLRGCLASLPDAVPEAAAQLAGLKASEWPAFLDYAASHGVLAILAPALVQCEPPSPIRDDVERRLAIQSIWSQHVTDALIVLLDLFAREGIPVCALKGPVFAKRFYDHPSDRPSIDIDLLVRPGQLESARAALVRAGYLGDSELSAAYLIEHAHHLHFMRESAPELELHFQAYHGLGTVIPAAALMDGAEEIDIAGRRTLVARPEDELIYLAVHAAGHSFIRLLWLFDLKLLIRKRTPDWRVVMSRGSDLEVASAVTYALGLLDRWLGVRNIPAEARTRYSKRSRVADRLLDLVAAPSTPSSVDNLGGLIFTAMLCDRVGATFGLAGHHLLRTARHRVHRLAPGLVPESWSA
jgi:hypothetical protein